MASNGYASHNGTPNGANRIPSGDGVRYTHRQKVLTVEEALPLTPFTSIVPFNSDIIPIPSVGLKSSVSLYKSKEDRNEAWNTLASFNVEAIDPQKTSRRIQQTLDDLKELLKPDGMTQFKFKTTPKISSRPELDDPPIPRLTELAQRVYNQTSMNYTCPSPDQRNQRTASGSSGRQAQRTPSMPKPVQSQSQRSASNHESFNHNSAIRAQPNVKHTSQTATPPRISPASSKPSSAIQIVIPSIPQNFKREEYTPSKSLEKSKVKHLPQPPRPSPHAPILPPIVPPPRTLSQPIVKPPAQHLARPPSQIPKSKSPIIPASSSFVVQIPAQPIQKPSPSIKPSSQPPNSVQPQAQTHTQPPVSTTLPPSGSNPSLSVIIPDLPPTFNPQDYEAVPDSPGTPQHSSRKRRRSEVDGYEEVLTIDQREKADAAARNLQFYLQEIFEAEDRLAFDNNSSNHLIFSTNEGISLTSVAQAKIEGLLQKIISMGRFAQAPLDELLRLQKLSDPALKDAESVDVKVDDSMGAYEATSWLERVAQADTGLKAARTSLRLMSGGREEKQLYSEDVIQSALNVFKNVMDNCVVPIVEMRSSAAAFKVLSAEKKIIINLLAQCRRVLSLLASIVGSVELSETVVNALEYLTSRLMFVENAPVERESVLGIAKFDSLRVVAMDVLAQIFLFHPSQRQDIFDGILTSLEKLPVAKQSARQFRLAEGGSVQHVSALIMRLVQTSTSWLDDSKERRRNKALEALNIEDDNSDVKPNGIAAPGDHFTIKSESRAEQQHVTAINELRDFTLPLKNTAQQNANYAVIFIVDRAMKSTKSGDAPYQRLFELFLDDFIACLGSPDWPAAELLLRLLMYKMVALAQGDKTPAPAKNMALEVLGKMGAGISELTSQVRKDALSIESTDSIAVDLVKFAEDSLKKSVASSELVSWSHGPYRVSLEFLNDRLSTDPQLQSAIGFFITAWAEKTTKTYEDIKDDEDDTPHIKKAYGRLAYRLRMMIADKQWLSTEYSFDSINPALARLAYSITLLNSDFYDGFPRILTILLAAMASDGATVRSKSLKSIMQVLDTDPTIFDRYPAVKERIIGCSRDSSSLVRDSALTLIGKCISSRPAAEGELIPSVLARVDDPVPNIRKRAMKLSKEIYLRNSDQELRSAIADSLLHRVADADENVQELARQTIEEVWMSPFYQAISKNDLSTQFKLSMADQVALMVKTVQRRGTIGTVLDKVLHTMLAKDLKGTTLKFLVCKSMVATMFETIIDNTAEEGSEAPSARDALQVLMIFAKANAKLFTPEQVQLLQPFAANVGTSDDLAVFRAVVVIFRHVLPHLSKVHNSFLAAVRKDLIVTITRVNQAILDDVIACLWIISSVLEDISNLTMIVLSTLQNIDKIRKLDLNDAKQTDAVRKLSRLLVICGICGKHCDFDTKADLFRSKFPAWKGDSVSKLMADTFAPLTNPSQPHEVRKGALEAIGMVCQSWPKNFSSANIYTAFQEVFREKETALEGVILRAFKDFLFLEEKRSEAGNEGLPGAAADPNAVLAIMGGGQGDGIAIGIAQRFLADIIRISLATHDDQALLATEVIGSIARQGLVHPKECGPTLIALETSPNSKIADIAVKEHGALHEKHETILEKEYMRAVQLAYSYQRDVVQDTHGAIVNPGSPFKSKLYLMIDVLKISKIKNRKKFFETLCSRIDFDPAKIKYSEVPNHLQFSQFIIENMAFFDYVSTDELLGAINGMEKVVAATGTGIAHAIETEIFQIGLDQPSQVDENGQSHAIQKPIDQNRLVLLTAASMMLSSLWSARTYLRRLYGLNTKRPENKGKAASKDVNKTPSKVAFVTGDKFWEENIATMAALDSEESMMKQCRTFVELLNFDQDFKVAAEGDDEAERTRLSTPSDDEGDSTPGPGGSGGGRKRKAASTPGGRKKRARSSSVPKGRSRPKGTGKRASVEKSDNEDGW
ncbi:ARM repeat-containing protein [Glarea lozoyensis ATCC 20868]|uniref:Sister chromatid cohesion protein n=1 Tax=Glarea lozoyensis (strain ATCC 20868 / MF5171) TaxID=1116229 RepID=S3DBC3_GLAL2|nr:ARM repeat-containing protein [Glarea lozoyensis ATCC 20868]EPE35752.1 ARM repeat-containing protein [Glarea lozoyensis ATCC 20868]